MPDEVWHPRGPLRTGHGRTQGLLLPLLAPWPEDSAKRVADLFEELNGGDLQSYLVEVTAALYRKDDDKPPLGVLEREVEGGSPERLDGRPSRPPLVDALLDVCGAKGTGKWTVQRSADLGVPCATIQAALDARALSALKGERKQAAALLNFDRRASFGPGSRKPLPAFEFDMW